MIPKRSHIFQNEWSIQPGGMDLHFSSERPPRVPLSIEPLIGNKLCGISDYKKAPDFDRGLSVSHNHYMTNCLAKYFAVNFSPVAFSIISFQ